MNKHKRIVSSAVAAVAVAGALTMAPAAGADDLIDSAVAGGSCAVTTAGLTKLFNKVRGGTLLAAAFTGAGAATCGTLFKNLQSGQAGTLVVQAPSGNLTNTVRLNDFRLNQPTVGRILQCSGYVFRAYQEACEQGVIGPPPA